MRYLILTRGIPGSGKSTFLKQNKLEAYTLSENLIQLEFEGPLLDMSGKLVISESHQDGVWETLKFHLNNKMKLGELIFIDSNHIKKQDLQRYDELIQHHKYTAFCLDFSDVSLEICSEQNKNSENHKIIPEAELKKIWSELKKENVPKNIEIIKPQNLLKLLSYEIPDYSSIKKIHHFGDIQGCLKPLTEYFSRYPIQGDELYIFVGDYCDRGNENHLVIEYMLQNYHRPNFILLEGNHEQYLWNWAYGLESKHHEFDISTKPQLEAAKIPKEQVKKFLESLKNVALYTYNEKTVLVTHGGMSTVPENPILIKSNQFIRGVGAYDNCDIIDTAFYNNTSSNQFQIHGHRNIQNYPTQVNPRCFNLEGKIEYGGHLRVVTLESKQDFEVIEVHNPI